MRLVDPPNGEIKRFSVQQFFKNAAEVWASSPRFCEAKIEKHAYLHQEKENAPRPSPSKIFLSNLQQGCIRSDGRFTQAKAGVEPPFADEGQIVSFRRKSCK